MKQQKKMITRICLNNWGGIDHKVLRLNEYVNLFSGKSGSGKSTVMDAIQVILYGSFSPSFLNKAADDAKNKRSVLSYLKGEQKDGSANREGSDFCSVIALEIEDTVGRMAACIGIAFEVRSSDSELKKYMYFSHSGYLPEPGYLTEDNYPYSNRDIRALIDSRAQSEESKSRADLNRIYPSKEAYLNAVYDRLLGCIDETRFITMQKSAIALKMTNGTGQFIRDYMFPKSTGGTIEKISEQLGAYRDIREKIEALKRKIDLLTAVKASGQELLNIRTDIVRAKAVLRCIDIEELKARMEGAADDIARINASLKNLEETERTLLESRESVENDLIRVTADLKASDLGSKEERLAELQKMAALLLRDRTQWESILTGLKKWEEDTVVTDYISNTLLHMLAAFGKGSVNTKQCEELRSRIEDEKQNIESELEECSEQKRKTALQLKEKQKLVEDMKNDRKSYPDDLRQARLALEQRLTDRYGRTIKVRIFADLFDVREEEWKNAAEGRLGRIKLSLITEPRYAHDAAVLFREMKQFEKVDLINSEAVVNSAPSVLQGSLYEAVETDEPYVDACLKRYLGHIVKCHTVEELEQVKDGVTPDCYSYSSFIFRHLKKKDYTVHACIGRKVSKAKLKEYEQDVIRLQKEYDEIVRMTERLKAAREFECLKGDPSYIVKLSQAGGELEAAMKEIEGLKETIGRLKTGQYRELEEQKHRLQKTREKLQDEIKTAISAVSEQKKQLGKRENEIAVQQDKLNELLVTYVPNQEIEAFVCESLKKRSGQSVKNQTSAEITAFNEREQQEAENLMAARNAYIAAYPTSGFTGAEKTNECYEKLLDDYLNDYEPKYQAEFEKQCEFIYKSLRENVIATIHGDIKAAKRHAADINRLLRETNFSDSTYQIKVEAAKDENGQFYEMLMAEELDSKNLDNGGYDGQLSFGEDEFYQKYEQKINLLIEKFMPPEAGKEGQLEQKKKEMERYADYRNYLSFSMYERVADEDGKILRENFVDEMAGRDSGGEGQNPKYVALLAGFAMLYMNQDSRASKIKLVLLDEAFSKMDQERSAVCLKYARKLNLQLIVCVPDERLQSLIRNVDCVYGFRRHQNQISMMHIDKGEYLKLMEGEGKEAGEENDSGATVF